MNAQTLGIKNASASRSAFSGDNVSFTLANQGSSAEDKLLAISPGWNSEAAAVKTISGAAAAAIIKEGTIISTSNKEVTGAGKNCQIDDVVKMFVNTPVFLTGLKIQVDNAAQLDEEIQFVKLSPRGPKEIARVIPSSFKNEANQDDKLISIDLTEMNIVLGIDAAVLMNLAASRKVTMTFFYKNKLSIRDMARTANDMINAQE